MDEPGREDEILKVDGLERRFGERVVFRDVGFALGPGETLIVRGPNGSGKTTLLRCIAGTLAPTRGSISVEGHPAGTIGGRTRVGVSLSQERSFYLRLSGRDNLLFFARVRLESKKLAAAAVRSLEGELELDAILDRPMASFSTGMLQQVAFARALIDEPPLLVLDEPTRSLDDAAIDRFWGALERRRDRAVVVVTHRHEDFPHGGRMLDLGS